MEINMRDLSEKLVLIIGLLFRIFLGFLWGLIGQQMNVVYLACVVF